MNSLSINDRVKLLRESLDKSQEQFGTAIGISKSGVSNIESGIRNVTEKHIKLICVAFPVNESWLRTGEGDMFSSTNSFDDFEQLLASLADDELIKRIIRSYLNLDDSGKLALQKLIDSFLPDESTPGRLPTNTRQQQEAKAPQEMTDAELHAELDRQLLEEKRQAGDQSAYGPGKSEKATG